MQISLIQKLKDTMNNRVAKQQIKDSIDKIYRAWENIQAKDRDHDYFECRIEESAELLQECLDKINELLSGVDTDG